MAGVPEKLRHRFFSCRYVKPLWTLIEKWMLAAVGDLVTMSTDAAIFLDYPKFKSVHLFSLIHILGGELKLAVWMQRNRKKV